MKLKTGLYRHYKGNDYDVIGFAQHTETEESFVVYRALYGDGLLWVRPQAMFFEEVTHNGVKQPRFRPII